MSNSSLDIMKIYCREHQYKERALRKSVSRFFPVFEKNTSPLKTTVAMNVSVSYNSLILKTGFVSLAVYNI